MSHPYLLESIWTDKPRADDAEKLYYTKANASCTNAVKNVSFNKAKPSSTSSLVDEIARARQQIKNSLQSASNISTPTGNDSALVSRVETLEKQNKDLKNVVQELQKSLSKLETRLSSLEGANAKTPSKPVENGIPTKPKKPAETVQSSKDDEDDIDLFGSEEEEDEDAAKLREKRVEEYAAKKSKKTAVIAKSSVVLDVKPWDDETDMAELEKQVRTIQIDGLVWGASKLVPLAFGIKKLQIVTIVEDDKVSIEDLQEKIQDFEDLVQSVDIAAFNKL